jgi:hypothetical protein
VRFSYEGAQASQPLSWSASPSLDSPSATAQPHTTEQLSLCPRLSLLHEPCSYYLGWPTPVPASRSRAQGTAGCRLDTTPAPSRLTSTLLASARSRSDQRCANASPRRTTRDSTTTLLLRAVPPRCRLCRPRHAARSDPRTMLCASIANSAGWPGWGRVS